MIGLDWIEKNQEFSLTFYHLIADTMCWTGWYVVNLHFVINWLKRFNGIFVQWFLFRFNNRQFLLAKRFFFLLHIADTSKGTLSTNMQTVFEKVELSRITNCVFVCIIVSMVYSTRRRTKYKWQLQFETHIMKMLGWCYSFHYSFHSFYARRT